MDEVIYYVERSNQRGGRILSVVDLLEAGTFNLEDVAWLLHRIEEGDSWLVGARPGGAGKTTVMSALLAMLPEGTVVRLTNTGSGWKAGRPGECIVSYELSPGFYDAYIWGWEVKQLTRLGLKGCRIVSNLHADTLEEAREQIVHQCGASEQEFGAFQIFLPVSLERGLFSNTPRVEEIHIFNHSGWLKLASERERNAREQAIAGFLSDCLKAGKWTVEEVRRAWLEWV